MVRRPWRMGRAHANEIRTFDSDGGAHVRLAGLTALVLVAAPLLGACEGGGADPEARIVVDTLPNGAVHVHNPATGLWGGDGGWELVEAVRIGALDGDGPDVFGEINGLAVDSRGRVHVLDRQADEIRVFDADGAHVRTLGGTGSGPGELQRAFGVGVDASDRVWAADEGNNRYTVWDPEGALVGTRTRPGRAWPYAWDATFDGDVLMELTLVEWDPAEPEGQVDGFLRVPVEGDGPVDTLPGIRPHHESQSFTVQDDQGAMFASVPFTPSLHRALEVGGANWFGVADEYRIVRVTPERDTTLIVSRAYDPVPVTPDERAEALDTEFLRTIQERGGEVDPARVPDAKPAFEGLFTDDRGHLWVRLPLPAGEEGTRFDVFDPQGRYLGAVRAPAVLQSTPRPVVRDGMLWAEARDALDIPHVVGYRIEGYGG